MTPTSVPGSNCWPQGRRDAATAPRGERAALGRPGGGASPPRTRASKARGFTLIELLVVLAIIALGAALISTALPDSLQTKLEEDGMRLAALLESARAQSRATGQAVHWEPSVDASFRFVGLPTATSPPTGWLSSGVSAEVVGATAVLLGPEPILPAQRIVLRLEDRRVVLASDGLSAFAVTSPAAP